MNVKHCVQNDQMMYYYEYLKLLITKSIFENMINYKYHYTCTCTVNHFIVC